MIDPDLLLFKSIYLNFNEEFMNSCNSKYTKKNGKFNIAANLTIESDELNIAKKHKLNKGTLNA